MKMGDAQRPIAGIVAAALVVAIAVGCGGDTRRGEEESAPATTRTGATTESPTPTPNPSPEKPIATKITDPVRRAYVGRVDSICARLDRERAGSEKRVAETAGAKEAARAYDDTIAIGWRQLHRIETVPVPPGDGPLLRANVFEPIRRQLAVRHQMAAALAAVELPKLRALRAELDDSARALTGFARGYGFRVCGED
jgi:hypothetical protein